MDVNELSVDHGPASDRVTIQRGVRVLSSGNHAVMGCIAENVAVKPVNYGILRADQTCGILSDRIKQRL
jgi:hypothetical protein